MCVCVCMSTCVYPCTESDFNIALCLKKISCSFLTIGAYFSFVWSIQSYVICFRSFKYTSVHKYRCLCTYFFFSKWLDMWLIEEYRYLRRVHLFYKVCATFYIATFKLWELQLVFIFIRAWNQRLVVFYSII